MKKKLIQLVGAALIAASGVGVYAADAEAACGSLVSWPSGGTANSTCTIAVNALYAYGVGTNSSPRQVGVYCENEANGTYDCGTNRFARTDGTNNSGASISGCRADTLGATTYSTGSNCGTATKITVNYYAF